MPVETEIDGNGLERNHRDCSAFTRKTPWMFARMGEVHASCVSFTALRRRGEVTAIGTPPILNYVWQGGLLSGAWLMMAT